MSRQNYLFDILKLIALCIMIACMIAMTVAMINLASMEQKQLETSALNREQEINDARTVAKIEVTARQREYKVIMENGRMFGWTAIQERIAEYNKWVIDKQTEVTLLGDKTPYYFTNVMDLNCIVGWGSTEESID